MSDSTTRAVVLDYGYVELVETWGSEERIIEAARMSTGRGFLGWGPGHAPGCREAAVVAHPEAEPTCSCGYNTPGDEKLLHYLHANARRHAVRDGRRYRRSQGSNLR